MNKILAKRYAFCDFSKIVGFPNPVPSRDEWECSLPKFRGEEWEVPAEHLLDFHEFIHRLQIIHEDVKIKLFKYSLEGIALDWCRSLPASSIHSLASFHYAFHSFCKDEFPAESLFEDCCGEFEKQVQQEVVLSPVCQNDYYENCIDVSVTPVVFDLHEGSVIEEHCSQIFKRVSHGVFSPERKEEDQEIVHFPMQNKGVLDSLVFDEEQYCHPETPAVDIETPATDIEKSSTEINKFACTVLEPRSADNNKPFIINNAVSLQPCSDLHAVEGGSYSRKKGMQRSSDVQSKQQEEVFSYSVIDPFADYLEYSSSINVKLLLSNKGWLCCTFKLYISILCFPAFIISRSEVLPVIQILVWLHWKHDFT
jgi:hypothetical protein